MHIWEIKEKKKWQDFLSAAMPDSFLQSWNWGEFNHADGEKIWRLAAGEHEGKTEAVALVILVTARRGKFLFVPHGPVFKSRASATVKKTALEALVLKIKKLAKKEKADFIRISPILEDSYEHRQLFRALDFQDAPIHMMHPEKTWLLDIQKDEETLLKEMKKNHRNLIRRAAKDGVEITSGTNESFLQAFYKIHMETVERHKFVPFSYAYIQKEIAAFAPDEQVKIFLAYYQKEVISAAIVVCDGHEAYYHHGASSSRHARVPSSYLVLWEAIRWAKTQGANIFNFYGIVDDNPKHPWFGLSRFKKGFGGYEKNLVHCQDLPLNKKYLITQAVEKIRKIKRGY